MRGRLIFKRSSGGQHWRLRHLLTLLTFLSSRSWEQSSCSLQAWGFQTAIALKRKDELRPSVSPVFPETSGRYAVVSVSHMAEQEASSDPDPIMFPPSEDGDWSELRLELDRNWDAEEYASGNDFMDPDEAAEAFAQSVRLARDCGRETVSSELESQNKADYSALNKQIPSPSWALTQQLTQAWTNLDYDMMKNNEKIMAELEELRNSFQSLSENGLPQKRVIKSNNYNASHGSAEKERSCPHKAQQSISAAPKLEISDWNTVKNGLARTEQMLLIALDNVGNSMDRLKIDALEPFADPAHILSQRISQSRQRTKQQQTSSTTSELSTIDYPGPYLDMASAKRPHKVSVSQSSPASDRSISEPWEALAGSYLKNLSPPTTSQRRNDPDHTPLRKSWLPQQSYNINRVRAPLHAAASSYPGYLASGGTVAPNTTAAVPVRNTEIPSSRSFSSISDLIYDPKGLMSQTERLPFNIKDQLDFAGYNYSEAEEQEITRKRNFVTTSVLSFIISSAVASAGLFPDVFKSAFSNLPIPPLRNDVSVTDKSQKTEEMDLSHDSTSLGATSPAKNVKNKMETTKQNSLTDSSVLKTSTDGPKKESQSSRLSYDEDPNSISDGSMMSDRMDTVSPKNRPRAVMTDAIAEPLKRQFSSSPLQDDSSQGAPFDAVEEFSGAISRGSSAFSNLWRDASVGYDKALRELTENIKRMTQDFEDASLDLDRTSNINSNEGSSAFDNLMSGLSEKYESKLDDLNRRLNGFPQDEAQGDTALSPLGSGSSNNDDDNKGLHSSREVVSRLADKYQEKLEDVQGEIGETEASATSLGLPDKAAHPDNSYKDQTKRLDTFSKGLDTQLEESEKVLSETGGAFPRSDVASPAGEASQADYPPLLRTVTGGREAARYPGKSMTSEYNGYTQGLSTKEYSYLSQPETSMLEYSVPNDSAHAHSGMPIEVAHNQQRLPDLLKTMFNEESSGLAYSYDPHTWANTAIIRMAPENSEIEVSYLWEVGEDDFPEGSQ